MMKRRTNLRKLKFQQLAVIVCLIGIFITGSVLRYGVYSNIFLQQHSPFLYFGCVLVYVYARAGKQDLCRTKFERRGLCLALFILIASLIIFAVNGSLMSNLNPYISMMVPLIVLPFRYRNKEDFLDASELWLFFCRFCMYFMLATELWDILTGYSATLAIAEFTKIPSLMRMYSQRRCVTYMGHSLVTSEMFLIGYISTHLIKKIQNKKEGFLDIMIPLLGIILTQSRAGVMLIIAAYFVFNLEWKRASKILLLLLLIVIGYQVGIFDSLLERIVSNIANGDFSAGRNSAIHTLMTSGQLQFFWLKGQNIAYDGSVTLLGMALEYPIISWAYSFGIFISVLLTLGYVVYPLLVALKRKNKEIFFAMLFIILDVMTFTGMSSNGDKPLFYAITFCMLMNILNYSNHV